MNNQRRQTKRKIIKEPKTEPVLSRKTFSVRNLLALTVGLGGIVTLVNNQILRAVVVATREVAVQNVLGTLGITDLGINGGTRHVGNHGVTTAPGVLSVTERVILGSGLGEPDITTISAEVTRLKSLSDVLLDDDSATSGVNEPSTGLHLRDEILVEQTAGLLVQGAVNGDNVTLSEHLLEVIDTTATNLLLGLRAQGLVIVVQKLLAVEGLETAQDTLTDTADSDGTDDLALKIILVLGDRSNVPLTALDLLVGRDEVTDQSQDGHDNVLSDGDDVGAGDLSNGDTTVGGVGSVQVNVIGTDTSSDSELEVLGLGQTLSSEVTGVEATKSYVSWICLRQACNMNMENLRSGDDNLSVDKLLVEGGVLALLVGGGHESVTGILEPLANTKLVLGGTEKTRLLLGVLTTLFKTKSVINISFGAVEFHPKRITYVVEDQKNLTLKIGRCG